MIARLILAAFVFSGLVICGFLWRCAILDRRDLLVLRQNGINATILQAQLRTVAALTAMGVGFGIVVLMSQFKIDLDGSWLGQVVLVGTTVGWWLIGLAALLSRRSITLQVGALQAKENLDV